MNTSLQGIFFISVGVIFLVGMDLFAKMLRVDHSPQEIIFYRSLVGLPLILAFGVGTGQFWKMVSLNQVSLHFARAACMGVGLWIFIYALALIPFSTLTALTFVTPLIMTILSILLLGEKVYGHRWVAIGVGFIGVLLIVRPVGGLTSVVFLVFVANLAWALGVIITRKMPSTVHIFSVVFWFMALQLIFSSFFVLPNGLQVLDTNGLLVAGLGVCGFWGQYFMASAYRMTDVSTVAPFEYTALIWAMAADILLFSIWPALTVWLGGGLIVVSGLYIAHRERVRASSIQTPHRARHVLHTPDS